MDHAEQGIQIMLVGNKVDAVKKNANAREVTLEEAKMFASSFTEVKS